MRTIALLSACGLLAACVSSHPINPQLAPASLSFAGATMERIAVANFDFTPHEIHLRAGRPYELVLANTASGGHDFAAPEFFAAARIKPGDAPLVADGKVDLPGMATRTVHLVPAAGAYKLVCTHTGHALLGMTGQIVVD
ncbi:MAG: copper-binding protein [Croceibacterium sp.]